MTLERDNPQRKSRKGPKRQSLRENRSSLSLGSTGDEVFDPAKHKKGTTAFCLWFDWTGQNQ